MVKILYIEDDENNIYMLKSRLERSGYEVIIAQDGKVGIDTAIEQLPDLIIIDISIPVVDGYEVTRRLKANTKTEKIPILVLTAHALVTDMKKAYEAGADEFETKPVDMVKLKNKMQKLLKKSK